MTEGGEITIEYERLSAQQCPWQARVNDGSWWAGHSLDQAVTRALGSWLAPDERQRRTEV